MNPEPHRAALEKLCRGYLGDAELAADAVQDLFRKIVEGAVEPERPLAWLRQAARNHCLNLLRARRRRPDREPLPSAFDAPAAWTGPLTRLLDLERAEDLGRLMALLTDEERELLRLRYADDLSRDEIAELVGLPPSVVKSRLFEAVEKLRRAR